jgi:di/tricarboxylate transporter
MSELMALGWEGWFTLAVVGGTTYGMAREKLGPDLLMFCALCLIVVAGILEPNDAFVGFAQPAVVTIGVLFVCAAAIQETGAILMISKLVFGQTKNTTLALFRLAVPTAVMSAFMNNTPIVAMLIPMVRTFAKRLKIHPSRLLIPLSYSAMLGGTCTLIGTSPNLVIAGLLEQRGNSLGVSDNPQYAPMGMLEISAIGIPITVFALIFLVGVGPLLLRRREAAIEKSTDAAKEYLAEVIVADDAPMIGQSIGSAGLRNLPGLFLVEIRRQDGVVVRPVAPQHQIMCGDHLVFTGIASTVSDLTQLPGLNPVEFVEDVNRGLFEVVISHRSDLVGQTVKGAEFRRRFNAAILAVHRAGERIEQKIGEIVLEPGDTLMLVASPGFRRAWQDSTSFYLVSDLLVEPPPRYQKANLALLTIGGLVLIPTLSETPMIVSAMGALVVLLGTRCISVRAARQSVNWSVLVLIGSAFGLANALEQTGAADAIGHLLLQVTEPFGPRAILAGVYLLGALFASFISNAAAAALLFPIAMTAAETAGLNPRAFAIALSLAASAGFCTPIGSQPNLLVYGPGSYRYLDYTRVGLPLLAITLTGCILFLPMIWPLTN